MMTKARFPRKPRRLPVLPAQLFTLETHVQEAIAEFLAYEDWRPFRTELTVQRERGRVVGEKGMPDYQFIRYGPKGTVGQDTILWIEFKRPGEQASANQVKWHQVERARGAQVVVVDDIDTFKAWYKKSIYYRRKIV